jgi:N-dimethylarginine dimethylaminohydrolase
MKYTCQSEYLPIQDVFVRRVSDTFISDAKIAREWKSLNYLGKPNLEKAQQEYQNFLQLFDAAQINTISMLRDDSLSMDAMYCRDAAIATDHGMILCNMGKVARRSEPQAHRLVYEAAGIHILGTIAAPGTLEGGDVAWLDRNTLAVGLTYRTNEAGIGQLKNLLEPYGIEVIVVDLPHYRGKSDVFHLMSIFSPVDQDLAVVYSPLMPIRFRNLLIERGIGLVEVPETEFDSMGCNVLAIAPRKCIMVAGNPLTVAALQQAGCEVLSYSGEEISVKGGGGPTCLTRPWKRRLP